MSSAHIGRAKDSCTRIYERSSTERRFRGETFAETKGRNLSLLLRRAARTTIGAPAIARALEICFGSGSISQIGCTHASDRRTRVTRVGCGTRSLARLLFCAETAQLHAEDAVHAEAMARQHVEARAAAAEARFD